MRGWIAYYGRFYRSKLSFLAWDIDEHLTRWTMRKFKRFRNRYLRRWYGCNGTAGNPRLFAHCQLFAFTDGGL